MPDHEMPGPDLISPDAAAGQGYQAMGPSYSLDDGPSADTNENPAYGRGNPNWEHDHEKDMD